MKKVHQHSIKVECLQIQKCTVYEAEHCIAFCSTLKLTASEHVITV